jgi:CRISPR-associated protein Cmr6
MVFDRPNRPTSPQKPSTSRPDTATQSAPTTPPKKVITIGGGGGGHGGGGGRNGGNQGKDESQPSPWLRETPDPDRSASFVEYLRWMRSPDSPYKDPTKVQILQMAEENADYSDRLNQLTNRTRLIAGEANCFEVKCPWRIRVGGHRGPESILLPAFDALGMPYIPSSTLRGVARNQAIRCFMAEEKLKWKEAEKKVVPYFGSLEAEVDNRVGKVIFLDAYPLSKVSGRSGGLAVDMANNIWKWVDDKVEYNPNPNPFLSLKEPTFLVGLRPSASCNLELFDQVKAWLILGLRSGIGSQVNTGYGQLPQVGQAANETAFLKLDFSLEGQLIHGRQKYNRVEQPYKKDRDRNFKFDRQGKLMPNTVSDAEVRPVAFKSMLRYWFRAFALGMLPINEVKRLEANLFGSITPQTRGWITLNITAGRESLPEAKGKNDPCGKQSGTLSLSFSSEAPQRNHQSLQTLFTHLSWMMFRLGGIGQGARRSRYSRKTREYAPWWRGSKLVPESDAPFWTLPNTVQEFQKQFRQNLQAFYKTLEDLSEQPIIGRAPLIVSSVQSDRWTEAVDANCRIIVCAGDEDYGKPYGLAVLHHRDFKEGQNYNGNLCGTVRPKAKPSPVWISDLGNYQVVTVFGATHDPRKKYVQALRDRTSPQNYAQIFPLG